MKVYLRYAVAALIIGFLLWRLDLGRTLEVLQSAEPFWFALTLAVFFVSIPLNTTNFTLLLRSTGTHVLFGKLMERYVHSFLAGMILPSKIGEFSIVYFLKKEGVELGKASAIVIADKAVTVAVGMVIAFFGTLLFMRDEAGYILWPFAGISLIGIAVAGALLLQEGRNLIRTILSKIPLLRKTPEHFTGFGKHLTGLITHYPHLLAGDAVLTASRYALSAFTLVFAFAAIGIEVTFLSMLFVYAVSFIISLVPITPGGIGLREGALVVLLARQGIAGEVTLAMIVLAIAAQYIAVGAWLALFGAVRQK